MDKKWDSNAEFQKACEQIGVSVGISALEIEKMIEPVFRAEREIMALVAKYQEKRPGRIRYLRRVRKQTQRKHK